MKIWSNKRKEAVADYLLEASVLLAVFPALDVLFHYPVMNSVEQEVLEITSSFALVSFLLGIFLKGGE